MRVANEPPDPLRFKQLFWPEVVFYPQQEEIIYSVRDNDETYVPAGNKLGKDFVAGFIALWWFWSRRPARVVTTSVKMDQLNDVLWGEIRRFLSTARMKLPFQYNHMKIRQVTDDGELFPNAELVGQVSNTQEGLLGRHSTAGFTPIQNDIPRTLVIFDEASGINDDTYMSTQTWAHRKLIIGNPFPCENFFKRGVKGGDLPRANGQGFHRKVIHIRATDSPNVRYSMAQVNRGLEPSNRILVPGVKDYNTYVQNRMLWDKVLQTVGLDAEFYEGAEVLLYPPEWLNRAESRHRKLLGTFRKAKGIGIDPAEGGDKTAMAAVDEYGLIELVSKKTPNTALITSEALAFARKHNVPFDRVVFDRGGGGKQHVDRLREQGYDGFRTVAFGESLTHDPKRGSNGYRSFDTRLDMVEGRYAYKNRRAQMYGALRELLDPEGDDSSPKETFSLPNIPELRRQLAVMPLLWDPEGRMRMLPKNKRDPDSKEKTLTELIGHSPDEADALVLAIYAMQHAVKRNLAGAIV